MIEAKYLVTIREDDDDHTLSVRDVRRVIINAIGEVNQRAETYGIALAGISVDVVAVQETPPASQEVIPLSKLTPTESLHLDALAAEEGLERTDFTVWRWNGLAVTECDGVTHDLTNGLDME